MEKKHRDFIRFEKRNTIAVLTLDNPPVNVLSDAVLDELSEAIEYLNKSSEIRAVVICAAGEKAFAAGADISQFPGLSKYSGIELVEKGKKIFDKLAEGKAPVICAIQGLVLGAGLELVLACDIRIAEEGAKLGFPETGLGILPGYGGTQRLSRLVGPGKAKELILSGVWLSGQEAYETKLVERLVTKGNALPAALELAGKIASNGPLAVAYAKQAVDAGLEVSLAEGQNLETRLFSLLVETKDMQEGVDAFNEKRKAEFKGV